VGKKNANRGLKLKFISIRKVKGRRGKGKTHAQIQRSDLRDLAKVQQLRQIGAEMV